MHTYRVTIVHFDQENTDRTFGKGLAVDAHGHAEAIDKALKIWKLDFGAQWPPSYVLKIERKTGRAEWVVEAGGPRGQEQAVVWFT